MMKPLLLLAATAFSLCAQPVKVLILTGQADLPYHHWEKTTQSIRTALEKTGRFDVRVIEEPRALTAAALRPYDVLLVNYNGPRWGAAAETAIEEFVRSGKGLVAFHHCSYGEFFGMTFTDGKWRDGSDKWAQWPQMTGASWEADKIGHARRWAFTVDWQDRTHPVASGLPPSFTANDELYHKLTLSPSAHVLADAMSPAEIGGTGKREPLIWTNRYGQGRVFYTVLGHDQTAFYQDGMINAFARGVEWAATGSVTIAPIDSIHAARSEKPVRMLVVTSGHAYPVEFYSMLASLEGVAWTHAASHAEAFARPLEDRYDVVLLHDMHNTTTEQTRARLKAFVEAGKGIIALHHAIVNYTDWPWWYESVTGGKYFEKAVEGHEASHYREGVEFLVTPVRGKERHPVLEGVVPLWVDDELYRGMWHAPGIDVLMETSHQGNDRPVVYAGPYAQARVLYIQLGHSAHTMNNPGFRRLMQNAVRWTARREK